MSHSAMIVADDPHLWLRHEAIDRRHPALHDTQGRQVSFAELERRDGTPFAREATLEHIAPQVQRTRAAIAHLRADLAALEIDVIVVFGDDQMELHSLDVVPALSVYCGDVLVMGSGVRFATYEAALGGALMRGYAMDAQHEFPAHPALARHLVDALRDAGHEVSAVDHVPGDGAGLGHAFGIVQTQLIEPGAIPLVPVLVNTFWPPNRVTPDLCYRIGRAVAGAIETYPEPLRIAVMASGGLSHLCTNEPLDRGLLEACWTHDEPTLRGMPPELLRGGSSEICNWIAVAAACREIPMVWLEYIPVYRSAVGTGVGLGFALWSAGR